MLAFAGKESAAGGRVAYEHNTRMLTITHMGSAGEPPTDLAGVRALAAQFLPPSMVAGLRSAQPRGRRGRWWPLRQYLETRRPHVPIPVGPFSDRRHAVHAESRLRTRHDNGRAGGARAARLCPGRNGRLG